MWKPCSADHLQWALLHPKPFIWKAISSFSAKAVRHFQLGFENSEVNCGAQGDMVHLIWALFILPMELSWDAAGCFGKGNIFQKRIVSSPAHRSRLKFSTLQNTKIPSSVKLLDRFTRHWKNALGFTWPRKKFFLLSQALPILLGPNGNTTKRRSPLFSNSNVFEH